MSAQQVIKDQQGKEVSVGLGCLSARLRRVKWVVVGCNAVYIQEKWKIEYATNEIIQNSHMFLLAAVLYCVQLLSSDMAWPVVLCG